MPREMTLQSARQEATGGTMDTDITHRDRTVWVSLSGILNQKGLEDLASRLAPFLGGQGRKVVLDGQSLVHMDYRTTGYLLAYHRKLKAHGHELFLHRWSDYLKAILVMEDWERELGTLPMRAESWRRLRRARPDARP